MDGIEKARRLRRNETWAEKLMWRWLRDRRFSQFKFRRQQAFGPYTLDFFCAEAKLSIELDGSEHGFPQRKAHDEARSRFLSEAGVMELRFWNRAVRERPESVKATIFRALHERASLRDGDSSTKKTLPL